VAAVKTPDYVRDNIHVDLLTGVYTRFIGQLCNGGIAAVKVNPSGYVESQGAFAERVAREVRPRTGWACALELLNQQDFSEPLHRTNTQPARELVSGWNEPVAWDAFVDFYR